MALLPPFFLDTVVAIGVGDDPLKRQWIGTGFVYGDLLGANGDKRNYRLWVITNKHVVTGLKKMFIKFNSAAEPNSKDYEVPLIASNGRPRWIGHPNPGTDVAAIFLHAGTLRTDQRHFAYFRSDAHVMPKQQMKTTGLTEGDRVFILGFPMGLVSAERQYVICRGGYLARIRDYLDDKASDYLVDGMVFPGNSGGPVVLCPSALAITGTNTIDKSDLIGIVKSYVPYNDVAISQQTKRPRVVFEENSGLTAVEPYDAIRETVELATRRLSTRLARAKYRAKRQAGAANKPPSKPNPS